MLFFSSLLALESLSVVLQQLVFPIQLLSFKCHVLFCLSHFLLVVDAAQVVLEQFLILLQPLHGLFVLSPLLHHRFCLLVLDVELLLPIFQINENFSVQFGDEFLLLDVLDVDLVFLDLIIDIFLMLLEGNPLALSVLYVLRVLPSDFGGQWLRFLDLQLLLLALVLLEVRDLV